MQCNAIYSIKINNHHDPDFRHYVSVAFLIMVSIQLELLKKTKKKQSTVSTKWHIGLTHP